MEALQGFAGPASGSCGGPTIPERWPRPRRTEFVKHGRKGERDRATGHLVVPCEVADCHPNAGAEFPDDFR